VAAFAREHGIHVTAYMPLAYGKALADPVIQSIAARVESDAGAGGAGVADGQGLCGDSVVDEAREPGREPGGAGRLSAADMPRSMRWSVASGW
jgi:hypothetical protein